MRKIKSFIILVLFIVTLLWNSGYANSQDFFNISLEKRWNLVSSPLQLYNESIDSVLSSMEGNYSLVTYFNGSHYMYNPNFPFFSNLGNINEKMGFWIKMKNDDVLELDGYYVNSTTIHLEKGWTMIGYPKIENQSAYSFLSEHDLKAIFAYDGKWISYIKNRPKNSLQVMQPGLGYFVHSGSEKNIVITNNISNNATVIDNIEIAPDDSGAAGVQVMPFVNGNKTVNVSVEVTDLDGVSDIVQVEMATPNGHVTLVQDSVIDSDTAVYFGSFNMEYFRNPQIYHVYVNATDGKSVAVGNRSFEYLSMQALIIDTQLIDFKNLEVGETAYVYGDLNVSTDDATIKNAGNVEIDANIYGSEMVGPESISVGYVNYKFGSNGFYNMTSTPSFNDLNLSVDGVINVDFSLTVPLGILPGNYNGNFTITAQ